MIIFDFSVSANFCTTQKVLLSFEKSKVDVYQTCDVLIAISEELFIAQ
jgi:hypothetical protein